MRLSRKEIGNLGESIACKYLQKRKHTVVERNYWKKWGEIDVITRHKKVVHFVEVKTVSGDVHAHQQNTDSYRAEDNVHNKKLERFARVVETYIEEHDVKNEWQIDVITVLLDVHTKKARVHMIENIIFE